MLIPIPIGVQRICTVQGTTLKVISCRCGTSYGYEIQLEASGGDHDLLFLDSEGSARRAAENAEEKLQLQSHNLIVPVPCPMCGRYQDDMARVLKDQASINVLQAAGAALFIASFIPLFLDVPLSWAITVVGSISGAALLARGYFIAYHYDPNSGNPESRISLGRRMSVWGDELAHLMRQAPNATSGRAEL